MQTFLIQKPAVRDARSGPLFTVLIFFVLLSSQSTASIVTTSGTGGLSITEDFSSLPHATEFDTYTGNSLIHFGEAFAGQTVFEVLGDEIISGTPTASLALLDPPSNNGFYTFGVGSIQGLAGAPGGGDGNIGEGALAMLFTDNINEFSIFLGVAPNYTLNFYRRDGSLFDSVDVVGQGIYHFSSIDSSPFAGVTITNTGPTGAQYDDVRLGAAIPEPNTVLLFCSALSITLIRRRSRRGNSFN